MTRTLTCIALLSAGWPAGLGGQVRPATPPQAVAPGDWAFPSHDLAATRFCPLNQLTARNVAGLKLLWSYSTGSLKGHEGNPLVVGGRLYLRLLFRRLLKFNGTAARQGRLFAVL